MSDPERLAEPLTDEELPEPPWTDDEVATLRENVAKQYRLGESNPFAASFLATIDTLRAQVTSLEGERDEAVREVERYKQFARDAAVRYDARAVAAEAALRETREALERIVTALEIADQRVPHTPAHDDAMDDAWDLLPVAREALAALASTPPAPPSDDQQVNNGE